MAELIVKTKKDTKGVDRKLFVVGSGTPTEVRAGKEGLFQTAAGAVVVREKVRDANRKVIGYKTENGDKHATKLGYVQYFTEKDLTAQPESLVEFANKAVDIAVQNVLRGDLEKLISGGKSTPTAVKQDGVDI